MRILAWILSLALLFAVPALAQNDEDWDVNEPFDELETIEFTVDEGTWMNLDVSPDGETIVFDLLGDIYRMPIEGGSATRILGGMAHHMQPRFSPDGSTISFTSDRGGGDNIWVMDPDGSDLRPISNEDFRLLNDAVWTPDGEYLIGRKHFTSTRSLGAGEMWMYHRSGSTAGIQLTERRTDEKNAAEPALSPDGRYLYWSEDMTPGQTFEYNQDPNEQVYAVRQLDRETGEIENMITGPGSAVRPVPSPDGDQIAFVRRVRSQSTLFLYDKETGAETPIYDELSRDQQETWAIHGVYPGFSWTPDGESIVLWAEGEIREIDVESGEAETIPFEAEVETEIAETVQSEQEPWQEEFRARMLRDVTTSPDGDHVVFHAAGYLWHMEHPGGTPERLTDADHFEYDPAFHPEGDRVVYTTWDDEEFSTVRAVDLDGQNETVVVDDPGYYHEPQFAPDGERVVYRRATGNTLIGTLHSVDTGLYHVSATGGEPELITEEGREPRFNKDGDRIYYLTGGGLSKEYKSIDLHGADERVLYQLRDVTTVVPSPDENWVAFQELHNVYIAPFPDTGGPFDLTKDTPALPVQQVSEDAGNYLHWSGDSETLHWAMGPEHYSLDVDEAFDFVGEDEDADPIESAERAEIELALESDVPTGSVAFTNAHLITMDGDEVIEDGTIVVEENRIASVGAAGEVDVPEDAHMVDAEGQTIMPGLVDAHAHEGHFFGGMMPQNNWYYHANLAFGVTTIHDPSANTENVFNQAEMVQAGTSVGPRVFSTGRILYGADGDFRAEIDNLDDARSHLQRLKSVGAFSVKSYNQPRRDQRQQVLQAAHELDMLVFPEGGSTFFHNMNMIADGHTGIEHAVPIAPLYDDMLNLWEATDVGYTPTLVVGYGGLWGENYWYQHQNVWENDRLMTFVPRDVVDPVSRRRTKAPDDEFWHFELAETAKDLIDRGIDVQLGAHGQMQGLAAHWELWMFEQGGMSEHEALRSATLHGARYLGMDHALGTLEEGKLADLIVLENNPLHDIRHSEDINYVMKNGRLYDAETMDEVGNHPRERDPFHFEREGVSDREVWDE